jgi:hypothetical protein
MRAAWLLLAFLALVSCSHPAAHPTAAAPIAVPTSGPLIVAPPPPRSNASGEAHINAQLERLDQELRQLRDAIDGATQEPGP